MSLRASGAAKVQVFNDAMGREGKRRNAVRRTRSFARVGPNADVAYLDDAKKKFDLPPVAAAESDRRPSQEFHRAFRAIQTSPPKSPLPGAARFLV